MADDFDTGTRAAACGGTTTVIPFAAQAKGQSLRAAVADYHRRAEGKAHHDGGVQHVVHRDIFVGLMRQIQYARTVGDAIADAPDPVHVLLVVGPGRGDIGGRAPQSRPDRRVERAGAIVRAARRSIPRTGPG